MSRHENTVSLYYTDLCEWISKSEAGYPHSLIAKIVATNVN